MAVQPMFVNNVGLPQHDVMTADSMSDDMLRHCAEQAAAFAQHNPYNPQAQQQAAWWAERLAAKQRAALAQLWLQQQQPQAQASAPTLTPSFQPGLAAAPPAPGQMGASGQIRSSAIH